RGLEMSPQLISPTPSCPNCSAEVRAAATFCGRCGKPVAGEELEPTLVQPASARLVEPDRLRRPSRLIYAGFGALALVALAGLVASLLSLSFISGERWARTSDLKDLNGKLSKAEHNVSALQAQTASLQESNKLLTKKI